MVWSGKLDPSVLGTAPAPPLLHALALTAFTFLNAFELLYEKIGGTSGASSFLLARAFIYSLAAAGLACVLARVVTRTAG